jgi:FemAB-related protein (PEP-CTERM system-associated)
MRVRIAEQKDVFDINQFVNNSDTSSSYLDYRWISVIEKSFDNKCYYLVCEESNGLISGALPLVQMKSMMFGNFLVSMPYFNYGGVCADDEESRNLLIAEAVRIGRQSRASHIEFRQEIPLNNGLPVKTSKVSMRLTLPSSPEDLWKSFPSKLRSQVRKPQKSGMNIRVGREDELDSFYHVFSVCMRDLGTPVYPKYFFRNILERFPESTWICSVYLEKVPIAAGFLVAFKDRLEIPWGASLRRYNPLSPNMLLYWSCLEFACKRGFRVFDFGRSTMGESTYRFKEQWGAIPYPMYWHYWIANDGTIPEINPHNPKYRFAIGMWKKLPVPLTILLGPRIVRKIP